MPRNKFKNNRVTTYPMRIVNDVYGKKKKLLKNPIIIIHRILHFLENES